MSKSKTYRELQFENEHVSVWKTVIAPDQPLDIHRHNAPRVIVGLKGGGLKRIAQDKASSTLHFETHKAYWIAADDPNGAHGNINTSNEPIEIMVIEMKTPKNLPLPSIPMD